MERIALPTLMLLMLLSASPAVTQAVSNGQIEDSAQRFVVEGVEGPRTFRIIRAWEAVEGYLTDIENVGPGNRESLFRSRVVAPFESVCRPSAAGFQLPPAATPARELRHWLDQLKSDDVTAIVTEALRNAGRHLAAPETTVCIYMADPESPVQFMQGVGGVALGGADTIVLWTHPRDGWVERLPYVVAHEYHHVAAQALYRGRFARTPLYVLTLEGRADTFASLLYPDNTAPWTRGATPEQEARVWKEIKPRLESSFPGFGQRYMIGNGSEIPYWSGYTIGAHMVRQFLNAHPGLSIKEWSSLSPERIYSGSGYEGRPVR